MNEIQGWGFFFISVKVLMWFNQNDLEKGLDTSLAGHFFEKGVGSGNKKARVGFSKRQHKPPKDLISWWLDSASTSVSSYKNLKTTPSSYS